MDKALITVEVAYALPDRQLILTVKIPKQSTVKTAIEASGILQEFSEIDLSVNRVGIFSKLTHLNASLRDLDRVEIYRALIADPKIIRRQRAQQAKLLSQKKSYVKSS